MQECKSPYIPLCTRLLHSTGILECKVECKPTLGIQPLVERRLHPVESVGRKTSHAPVPPVPPGGPADVNQTCHQAPCAGRHQNVAGDKAVSDSAAVNDITALVELLRSHREDLPAEVAEAIVRVEARFGGVIVGVALDDPDTELSVHRHRDQRTAFCFACKGHHLWRSVYGAVVCGDCHPPAAEHLVAAWLDEQGTP